MAQGCVSVGGQIATHARLRLPLSGVWTLSARLDTTELVKGAVRVEWMGVPFNGFVARSWLDGMAQNVEVVGGGGGLGERVKAHGFRNTKGRIILKAILDDVGEVAAPMASVLGDRDFKWYCVLGGKRASETLDRLCEHLGAMWSVTADGKVSVGAPRWKNASEDYTLLSVCGETIVFQPNNAGAVMPGMMMHGWRVLSVQHVLTPDRYVCEASVQPSMKAVLAPWRQDNGR